MDDQYAAASHAIFLKETGIFYFTGQTPAVVREVSIWAIMPAVGLTRD